MRVFIQRCEDGLFCKGEGTWVASKEEAKDFNNCNPAIEFCVQHGLQDVRLWVSFGDPQYDFPIEIFRDETPGLVRHDKEQAERDRALPAAKQRKKPFSGASADPSREG